MTAAAHVRYVEGGFLSVEAALTGPGGERLAYGVGLLRGGDRPAETGPMKTDTLAEMPLGRMHRN